jgi:hypothetical protein
MAQMAALHAQEQQVRYKGVTRVVLLALVVLQMCHAGGVADTGSVTNMSHGWCCWHWQCHKGVTQVVLLALVVLQMCHADGVAGTGKCYKCVTVLQMCHTVGVAGTVL